MYTERSDEFLLTDEANRIDAAFIRIDYSGSGTLDESEVAAMPLGPY